MEEENTSMASTLVNFMLTHQNNPDVPTDPEEFAKKCNAIMAVVKKLTTEQLEAVTRTENPTNILIDFEGDTMDDLLTKLIVQKKTGFIRFNDDVFEIKEEDSLSDVIKRKLEGEDLVFDERFDKLEAFYSENESEFSSMFEHTIVRYSIFSQVADCLKFFENNASYLSKYKKHLINDRKQILKEIFHLEREAQFVESVLNIYLPTIENIK